MARRRVASRADVPEGQAIVVEAGDQRLALCNVGGQIYAIDDVCTHDGGPLGEGTLIGDQIECPRHGARFDVRSGRVTQMPAVRPVKTYTLEQEGDDLYVDLPDDDW
jgi:3-phenylpropionate/trans-cinnamate dioxygenase ferredoxin component